MQIYESEKGMSLAQSGIERGFQMVRFLDREIGNLERKVVLDIGCGLGGITLALAERCRMVVGMDHDIPHRLSIFQKRLKERRCRNIVAIAADCLNLPFRPKTFDLILMNGVLEWLGESNGSRPPMEIQGAVLESICRLLKDSGVLYLAIENRYYPANAVIDPHARLPLVAFLPRAFASVVSQLLSKKPYRTHIYSYWGLKRLLARAGFHHQEFFVPMTNYYYPYELVSIEDRRGMIAALAKFPVGCLTPEYIAQVRGRYGYFKWKYLHLVTRLGLLKLLCHSFIVLCGKDRCGGTYA